MQLYELTDSDANQLDAGAVIAYGANSAQNAMMACT